MLIAFGGLLGDFRDAVHSKMIAAGSKSMIELLLLDVKTRKRRLGVRAFLRAGDIAAINSHVNH